jgi:hypothetical protein
MDEDFDLLPLIIEEAEFCDKLQLKITGIEIGVEVLHLLYFRGLVPWQGEASFLYGFPIKISTNQNPWTVRFERQDLTTEQMK